MQGIRDLSDIVAIESVPLAERGLPENTYDLVARSTNSNASAIALQFFLSVKDIEKSVSYSYAEFLGKITQTANYLRSIGIERDSSLNLILPNLPQTLFLMIGGETAGVISPLNPTLEVEGLRRLIEGSRSDLVVTLAPLPGTDIYQNTIAALEGLKGKYKLITVDPGHFLGGIKRTGLKWARKKLNLPKIPDNVDLIGDFDSLVETSSPKALSFSDLPKADDIASMFHTGGTTGQPKLALHSHRNEVCNSWMGSVAAGVETSGFVFLCGLPLFHCNAFTVTGLVPWMFGNTVVLGTPKGFRGEGMIDDFAKVVSYFKINFFSGVPTIYSRLLEKLPERSDLSSLRYALCGAAPLSEKLVESFESKTGVTILEGYGLTESNCIATVNPSEGSRKVGSVGLRLPYSSLLIAQSREGNFLREAGPGEIGRVLLKGPHIFPGYLDSDHNSGVWFETSIDDEVWLDTGDLGYLDSDGFLWLTGRSKDIIIRGGHNIDPSNVEKLLEDHKDVERAIVIARPSSDLGEVPVAYVTLLPGHQTSSLELTIYSRQHLPEKQSIPETIYVVDELPLTQVGKVHRPTLRHQQIKAVFEEEISKLQGVVSTDVKVVSDPEHGTKAEISIKTHTSVDYAQFQRELSAALGRYTIFYTTTLST